MSGHAGSKSAAKVAFALAICGRPSKSLLLLYRGNVSSNHRSVTGVYVCLLALLGAALCCARPAAAQQLVHRSTFDGGPAPGWSSTVLSPHPSNGGLYLGGFHNEPVQLNLSQLPAHNAL